VDIKILIKCKDDLILILTLDREPAILYYSTLDFYNLGVGSKEAGQLAMEFINGGYYKSVRVTKKTREEVLEELQRNYGNIVHLEQKDLEEEDNG
jgi:hypothetical protein